MGFKEALKRLTESLENLDFENFLDRPEIWRKNKLYTREVDVKFVLEKIEEVNEDTNYHCEDSWDADDNKSHIFINEDWYIKYILKDGIVNIISVHEDE